MNTLRTFVFYKKIYDAQKYKPVQKHDTTVVRNIFVHYRPKKKITRTIELEWG